MQVNAKKCNGLRIGAKLTNEFRDLIHYRIDDHVIIFHPVVRDLGVLMPETFCFSNHCSDLCGKASRKIGMLCRAFRSRDLEFMRILYITHVRSILEYCCEIWSPYTLNDMDKIEIVQKKFSP